MIDEVKLKELKRVQFSALEILEELKRICDQHNIEYYLIGGTLIGAIRHKGFIPWDDDIDVGIKRKDYEKFLEVSKTELDSRFTLQAPFKGEQSVFPFTKIRLNNTLYIEKPTEKFDIHHGIFIDVFPLDYTYENKILRKLHFKSIRFLKYIRLGKIFRLKPNGWKIKMIEKISEKISFDQFNKVLNCYLIINNILTSKKLLGNFMGAYDLQKEIVPSEYFKSSLMIDFEDKSFKVPVRYNDYLTNVYGDYLMLPPKEKQVGHPVVKVRFNEEFQISQHEYMYDITIIIPIYNSYVFLEETLNSVIDNFDKYLRVEVLLVNDGSKDNSEEIALKYTNKYNNIKYHFKENGGVSSARNYGLENAKGKYILFLDSDDLLASGTLNSVVYWFEKYESKADILVFPIVKYIGGKVLNHVRSYKYEKPGLIDLEENPYFNHTTINTVIKNGLNIRFDENLKYAEDAFFNTQVALQNNKIIVCNEGKYFYRQDVFSAVDKYRNPANICWDLIIYFEKLMDYSIIKYGKVTKYVQSIILYEMNWRLLENYLYPHHLNEDLTVQWYSRFNSILNTIEVEVINGQELMDTYIKAYFIKMKEAVQGQFIKNVELKDNTIVLYENGEEKRTFSQVTLITDYLNIEDNVLTIRGRIREEWLAYVSKLKLFVHENEKIIEIPLYVSNDSFYKSNEFTNLIYGFEYKYKLTQSHLRFLIEINGEILKTNFYIANHSIFSQKIKNKKYVSGKFEIYYQNNPLRFTINPVSKKEVKKINKQNLKALNTNMGKKFPLLKKYFNIQLLDNLSLYNDIPEVFGENFKAFKNTNSSNAYYVVYSDREFEYLKNKGEKRIVKFGSIKHKKLFINAKKIYTASNEKRFYFPFADTTYDILKNDEFKEIIYKPLEPLITFEPKKFIKEKSLITKYIVNYEFEKEILLKYKIADSQIKISEISPKINYKPVNKLLLNFTWRKTLIDGFNLNSVIYNKYKFINSKYFSELKSLLESKEFHFYIKSNNLEVDLLLHPFFQGYLNEFDNLEVSYKINLINFTEFYETQTFYNVLITDLSLLAKSRVLDENIYQFIPDYDEFLNYNHNFNEVAQLSSNPVAKNKEQLNNILNTNISVINN